MKFLYHHRAFGKGADGNHIRQVVGALRALGHSVRVVSPPGVDVWAASAEKKPVQAGHIRPARRSARLPRFFVECAELVYTIVSFFRITRALKNEAPVDVIYERYWIFGWAATWAAVSKRIPIVLEVNFTSQTLDSIYPPRSKFFTAFAARIDRWIFNRASGIVVVTQALKRHLVERYGVGAEKIIVTPNAVDPKVFYPGIEDRDVRLRLGLNGRRVVGFVGGFYPWHGVDLLIEAAREALKQDPEIVFILIGEGYARPQMQERVKVLGLERSFIFTGHLPHASLPQYMAAFDVCVMPDSNAYGCPMKILEYMGMAKAVVAPRLETIEEILTDGREGILFEPQSTQELARSILKLLDDRALSATLGRNGHERVGRQYTWEGNVREMIHLCEGFKR